MLLKNHFLSVFLRRQIPLNVSCLHESSAQCFFTMAPLTTASTIGSFDWSKFTEGLLSDLAPLLALFGEPVTRQFLSMSVGWADNFLLAMCPIGIITIMVSAIRINSKGKMKALIGR